MTQLESLLRELEVEWRRVGCLDPSLLAPGLPPDAVVAILRSAGLEPVPELVEWFGWHNGLTAAASTQPGPVFLQPQGFELVAVEQPFQLYLEPSRFAAISIEQALRLRAQLMEFGKQLSVDAIGEFGPDGEEAQPGYFFEPFWLPIGSGSGGDLVVTTAGAANTCAVYEVSWSDGTFRAPRATSIAELVELWLHVLRTYFRKTETPPGWAFEFTDLPVELRVSGLIG